MLDANQLRNALAETAARLKAARGFELDVPAIQALESERRALQARTQELQNKRNTSSKAIGMAKARGEDVSKIMAEVAGLGEELKGWETRLDEIKAELDSIALGVPNIPQADVPEGRDEHANVEIKRVGTIESVEQLARYLERIRLDPGKADCRGVLAASVIKPQAKVLAEARGIACVEVDLAELRGEREPALTLFA